MAMSSFSIPNFRPAVQAQQKGLIPSLDPKTGITYYLNSKTGAVEMTNDPAKSSLLDKIVKGLAIAGVGAGYGAGALQLAGLGASLPGAAATTGAADAGSAGALGASAPLSTAADLAAQNAVIAAGGIEQVPIYGTLAAGAGSNIAPTLAALAPGALGGGALDAALSGGAAGDTLDAPEQVLIRGNLPAAPSPSTIPLDLLNAGALASAIPTPATGDLPLDQFGVNQPATPDGKDWTPGPGGFPETGYTDAGGFPLDLATASAPAAAAKGLFGIPGLTPGGLGLGALSLLGGLSTNRAPTSASAATPAASQGALANTPLGAAGNYLNRQAVQNYSPASAWYRYGEVGNQPQFFTGNQLTFPGWGGTAMARGGALDRHYSAGGESRGHVRGGGDGLSDSIPARLSSGEYVLTSSDVSRIGGGDTESGVRKLDQMRSAIARDAGARKYQGKVKHPMQYLKRKRAR